MNEDTLPAHAVDLVVVGAGVVGLAHAAEARRRGLSVVVVERDEFAVGASVRNFGHICITPQAGRALDYALAGRARWIALAAAAGFDLRESGTVVAARSAAELHVLEEFAAGRDSEQVRLLTAAEVTRRASVADPGLLGGALLPLDLRTDPRAAAPALATYLSSQDVPVSWRTSVIAVEPGRVHTSRGPISCAKAVVAVGHDVDRLFPDVADSIGLRRCRLQMLQVSAPGRRAIDPAVLTGTSLLRYNGFAGLPAADAVRAELAATAPELLTAAVNLMFTQRPDGDLVIGDTHHYGLAHEPFDHEDLADLILAESARLLGVPTLTVTRRWRGVYASSEVTDFLNHPLTDDIRIVSVTSGIGMTTCHGLAAAVLDSLL